jgi:hypothetical protein
MLDRTSAAWLVRLFRPPMPMGGSLDQPSRYTVPEVRAALRQSASDARTRHVHDCLARIGSSIDDVSVRQRFRGLEDYHRRLLRILSLYCRGWDVEAIAANLSTFSTGVGVDRAIDVAAEVIVDQLNRRRAA